MRGAYCDMSARAAPSACVHLVEDEQPAAARLLQRFLHDGGGDVGHLDIHLQAGDAVASCRRP